LISWISLGRYLLPAIGAYIVLAKALDHVPWPQMIKIGVVAISSILLTMLVIMFGHGYWVI
jgi:hypothetical protein